MQVHLQSEMGIESDEEEIRNKALEIVGTIKDPVQKARRIMAWVYGHVQKKPVLSVPSAVHVLKTREGDCNEHAVLLAALLRASGIPARIAVGLVYTRGKFFYHAWTECYLDRWISMDATLNQMPSDITHIKLVQGGLEEQTKIIGLIGKLRIEILEYR
jgi:transglutaminase-like putative cysteine protease